MVLQLLLQLLLLQVSALLQLAPRSPGPPPVLFLQVSALLQLVPLSPGAPAGLWLLLPVSYTHLTLPTKA